MFYNPAYHPVNHLAIIHDAGSTWEPVVESGTGLCCSQPKARASMLGSREQCS